MDIGLLRDFGCLEDYSSSVPIMDDSSNSNDFWEFDQEQEINGDLALIPVSSSLCEPYNVLSNSPPNKEDFNKIMCDWQQFINIEQDGALDQVITQEVDASKTTAEADDLNIANSFDIAAYLNDSFTATNFDKKPAVDKRVHGAGQKKIDLKAQRYIYEDDEDDDDANEDDVDVETLSENESSPVLEAGDITTLLEQFEATELPKEVPKKDEEKRFDPEDFLQKDSPVVKKKEEKPAVAPVVAATPSPKKSPIKPPPSTTSSADPTNQNNMILNQLPKELIERIKESGKRKPISVIPPMPTKKRGHSSRPVTDTTINIRNQKLGQKPPDTVKLDHDYCGVQTNYAKHPKKDSGFESSEDDDRINIKHQKLVKATDGTLMVSLLKVNTIHEETKKRKLNLEDYKKRRGCVLRTKNTTSQSCSPLSSSCSSPVPEDEQSRRLRHQEKLMRMAKEVLNAAPKSEAPTTPSPAPKVVVTPPAPPPKVAPVPEVIPANMIKKTVVSIGINTDFVTIDQEFKDGALDRLAPVQQLEEIKPLLDKVGGQISRNSLITAVIENIPKVITQCKSPNNVPVADGAAKKSTEHGEDKTILFLPKDKKSIKTVSTGVQTNISLLAGIKQRRYRRRNSSCSSTSSEDSVASSRMSYSRRRKLSTSSTYSDSDSDSSASSYAYSRSSSRSRSRSTSPRPAKKTRTIDREHLKEVEERRVIYVGRIAPNATKDELRKRFTRFGSITNVSLHFRDHGDNYGFVTFADKFDAYEAIEHGNDDPYYPKYDISFGGRRLFCQTSYSDLDDVRDEIALQQQRPDNSFDRLLKEAQEKLRKRKV